MRRVGEDAPIRTQVRHLAHRSARAAILPGLLILLTTFFALLLLGNASGFERIRSLGEPVAWSSPMVSFQLNASGAAGIDDGSDFGAIRSAFQSWEAVDSSSLAFSDDGLTTSARNSGDGKNVITFDENFIFGSSALAVTVVVYNGAGAITDTDIVYNDKDFSFRSDSQGSGYDIEAIAAHEIGHLIGLDHSTVSGATMFPYYHSGARTLELDDRAGASNSYPGQGFFETTAGLSGFVLDGEQGAPVFGANVVAATESGTEVLSDLTEPDGAFDLSGLPEGSYRIRLKPLTWSASGVSRANFGSFWSSADTGFPTEWYDSAESGYDNGDEFSVVQVFSGATVAGITLVTNTGSFEPPSPNQPPTAQIISPADGSFGRVGVPVHFEGEAFDMEDGAVQDAQLEWHSDRDGYLGSGALIDVLLPQGAHVVSLVAYDSEGESDTATVNLTVELQNQLPSLVILSPTPGQTITGPSVLLECTATDPEDGQLSDNDIFWYDDTTSEWIGSGRTLSLSYVPGEYVVLALAMDSEGGVSYGSVNFTVTSAPLRTCIKWDKKKNKCKKYKKAKAEKSKKKKKKQKKKKKKKR